MEQSTYFSIPDHLQDYSFRPARLEDAPGIHKMYIAIDAADRLSWAGSQEEVEHDFQDPGSNPEKDTLLVLSPNGEVAGLGWAFVNLKAVRQRRAFLWGCVHPNHRKQKLGETILSWLEVRGSQRLAEYQEDLPHVLRVNSPDHLTDRVELFKKHGYEPMRYFNRMRRDLSQPIPEKPTPAGISIRKWDPGLDLSALETINEAFYDHWGSEPMTAESWKLHYSASSSFRPDMTFLALDGERMVGACMNRVFHEDNARAGIKEGWIGTLGVLREWRGRGLASTLIAESMQAFKADGLEYAGLGVDSENLTGALKLYEKMGFYTIERTISWTKPPLEL
jgi:mycothiol synthase